MHLDFLLTVELSVTREQCAVVAAIDREPAYVAEVLLFDELFDP
jgi:hypothetical protein